MLVAGAFLGPPVTDIYRSFRPSDESVALSNLGQKVDDIDQEAEERDKQQSQKLDEVLAMQGNEKAREEYLAAQRELVKLYAERTVRESDDELLKKQRESRIKIREVSEEVAAKCELRWSPAYFFIISLLDKEIGRLNKKGYVHKVSTLEVPLVVVERQPIIDPIRRVYLTDGSRIDVIQQSGRIEAGHLQRAFEIMIRYDRPHHPVIHLLAFRFNLSEAWCEVRVADLGITTLHTTEPPMSQEAYRKAVPVALRKAINHVIVKSEIELG